MEVQGDGRIVVAGAAARSGSSAYDLALVRYTSSGSLDSTFSGDGKVTLSLAQSVDTGPQQMDVALNGAQAGKIVVVGRINNVQPNVAAIFVARFNADGSA